MPSVPIYIRKADYDKWLAIEDKSQFISDAINKLPNKVPSNTFFRQEYPPADNEVRYTNPESTA